MKSGELRSGIKSEVESAVARARRWMAGQCGRRSAVAVAVRRESAARPNQSRELNK